jgi:hypothetical protein
MCRDFAVGARKAAVVVAVIHFSLQGFLRVRVRLWLRRRLGLRLCMWFQLRLGLGLGLGLGLRLVVECVAIWNQVLRVEICVQPSARLWSGCHQSAGR